MTLRLPVCMLFVVALTVGTPALGKADLLNISDGTSTFTWNPDTGANTLSASFDTNYSFSFTPMLRFRRPNLFFPGANQITTVTMADNASIDIISNSANSNGANGTAHVDVMFERGLQGPLDQFDVDFSFTIGSTPAGDSMLSYSMTVTNTSANDITDVELFQYYDWDLINNQNSGEDYQVGGFTGFMQRVNPGSGDPGTMNAFHGTDNFQNWEVADWPTIEDKLLAGGSLSNSGTPYAVADMTAAFGWTLGTLGAGESFTVNFFITTIPEPSTTIVMVFGSMGLAGLWYARRRRNK